MELHGLIPRLISPGFVILQAIKILGIGKAGYEARATLTMLTSNSANRLRQRGMHSAKWKQDCHSVAIHVAPHSGLCYSRDDNTRAGTINRLID